jgi:hypothetical protein
MTGSLGNDPVVDDLLERVAQLEDEVARLKEVVGFDERLDPLEVGTMMFRQSTKAKQKVGIKPPRR